MSWRHYLREAWNNLPSGLRRLLVALLAAALGLMLLSFVLPPEYQLWPVLGLVGLFVVVQAVILWRLWGQRPALRQAQQLYMRGDFEGAAQILEADQTQERRDPAAGALLGNAYRQLGRLEDSARVLHTAYELEPDAPYTAYGLGRTFLAQGRYEDAAELIAYALAQRAQPTVAVDLALTWFYAGERGRAADALRRVDDLVLEPYRELMAVYLRWQLGGGQADEAARTRLARSKQGLAFWQAEADRFAATPYGLALAQDVRRIAAQLSDAADAEI